jgi:hypothetical protein
VILQIETLRAVFDLIDERAFTSEVGLGVDDTDVAKLSSVNHANVGTRSRRNQAKDREDDHDKEVFECRHSRGLVHDL